MKMNIKPWKSMFQRIKTKGKSYNSFYEANISVSISLKNSKGKESRGSTTHKYRWKILNKILADQIQWRVFKNQEFK